MASCVNKNFSGMIEPPAESITETYVGCNFSQPAAITDPVTGKKTGVPIFPGSRGTPREFFDCNLTNCDVPPNSFVDRKCSTAVVTWEVDEEIIVVKSQPVSRITKRRQVAHGRYVHDGTDRTYEEALEK